MKKFFLIVCLFCAALTLSAQEAQPDSTATDSMTVESLELVPIVPFYEQWSDSDLTDLEMRSLDWSLRWLDTTGCVAVHDTTTLPDSIYKARLQALPCVIELPQVPLQEELFCSQEEQGNA